MPQPPALKSSLKRGALLAAANWPLIAVQFVAEGTLKLLLAVPVVGGIFLVVLLLGADLEEVLAGDVREIIGAVLMALGANPVALTAFGAAFVLVLLGGSTLTFVVKGGTVAILAEAEEQAGPIERPPLRLAALRRANRTNIEPFLEGLPAARAPLREARRVPPGCLRATAVIYLSFIIGGYALAGNFGRAPRLDVRGGAGVECAGRLDHADQFPLPADADGDRGRGSRRPRRRWRGWHSSSASACARSPASSASSSSWWSSPRLRRSWPPRASD